LQAAARHYRAYLQIVAAHPGEYQGKKSAVLAVYIKIADADAAANHPAEALQGYNAAIDFAAKAGDRALESLASRIGRSYRKNKETPRVRHNRINAHWLWMIPSPRRAGRRAIG
jgi:hypothetical protein